MGEVMKEKKRRNTFMQGLSKLLIGICGIAGFLASFLCALCPLINPSVFVWTAFFGLGFWVIFFFNVIILIILILLKSRRTLIIPILALLFSVPGFKKSYSFGEKKDGDANLKVMTYNVGVFRDYKDNSKAVRDVKKSLADFINQHDPDVVCLQESGKWPNNSASDFSKMTDYKYYSINLRSGNSYFSKYPIEDVHVLTDDRISMFADIKKVSVDENEFLYVVNCHFNSFRISKEEIEYINDTKNIVKDSETYGKSLVSKLKNGFELRANSTELLLKSLPVGVPLIICGDFNDTPLSYTYSRMSKSGLHDAFISSSNGVGKTYCGSLPLLRIDYFWHNDMVDVVDFERIKQTTSDHYPLIITIDLKSEEISRGGE